MTQPCTWCGTEFEPQVTGRSVKRFCSNDCRQRFHAACRIWGEDAYGTGEASIFQLRVCFARRARRTERDRVNTGHQASSQAQARPDGRQDAVYQNP